MRISPSAEHHQNINANARFSESGYRNPIRFTSDLSLFTETSSKLQTHRLSIVDFSFHTRCVHSFK